jgi:hypothetical protein
LLATGIEARNSFVAAELEFTAAGKFGGLDRVLIRQVKFEVKLVVFCIQGSCSLALGGAGGYLLDCIIFLVG